MVWVISKYTMVYLPRGIVLLNDTIEFNVSFGFDTYTTRINGTHREKEIALEAEIHPWQMFDHKRSN